MGDARSRPYHVCIIIKIKKIPLDFIIFITEQSSHVSRVWCGAGYWRGVILSTQPGYQVSFLTDQHQTPDNGRERELVSPARTVSLNIIYISTITAIFYQFSNCIGLILQLFSATPSLLLCLCDHCNNEWLINTVIFYFVD